MQKGEGQKLVADAMLVKMARWLRLFGVSVKEIKYKNDKMILAYVKRNDATLLTCDRTAYQMARKRRIGCIFIPNMDFDHQLAYVFKALGRAPKINRLRCTLCNRQIMPISKSFAKSHNTPANALRQNNKFYYCSACKKIYWHGSHWVHIRKRAWRVKDILSSRPILGSLPQPRPR